jgi:hypothetical protein
MRGARGSRESLIIGSSDRRSHEIELAVTVESCQPVAIRIAVAQFRDRDWGVEQPEGRIDVLRARVKPK